MKYILAAIILTIGLCAGLLVLLMGGIGMLIDDFKIHTRRWRVYRIIFKRYRRTSRKFKFTKLFYRKTGYGIPPDKEFFIWD